MPPNTYEPPSRQGLDFSRPIVALGPDAWLRASVNPQKQPYMIT
jgi:hypothetical protein